MHARARPGRNGALARAVYACAILLSPAAVPLAADPPTRAAPRASAVESFRPALALQIALEARGYSPGIIDGLPGPRTRLALAAFQDASGLPVTGEADAATLERLRPEPDRALGIYRISGADLAEVEAPARDWLEKSRRRSLLYPSLQNLVAERAQTSERFLAAANPGLELAALKAGDALVVPAVDASRRAPLFPERIEIDLERKVVLIFSAPGRRPPAGLLHCSIAADPTKAVPGEARVAVVAEDPTYTFDPVKWPEVPGISRKLTIPPGPRSPVGRRWIGLDRDGVGIHGSPEPEMIGKTGSHGCFRLTNWDAVWLAASVRAGLRVRIVRAARESGWSWGGPPEAATPLASSR